ncbi:MAG TPA: hypothetical protein DGG95_00625 [Cytophagales bacterium]|jgi:hypothetical protein|nr:hypothetical protein [Cytophagales bacterium]
MQTSIPKSQVVTRRKASKHVEESEVEKTPDNDAVTQKILARQANKTLAEQVANHHFYYRNFYWPGGKQVFPSQYRMHHVDKYFPYAEGGPLFVDEVEANDPRSFEEKKVAMKKLGHRYLVITKDMTLLHAYEALA